VSGTVVLAPDSFKSSVGAAAAAAALAVGIDETAAPGTDVRVLPLADGGEGTLDAVLAAHPDAETHHVMVELPSGGHRARWLRLPDGTGVVELSECCGLPLLGTGRPLQASSGPLGVVLRSAVETGVERLVVGLGGSASTDGGAGCLQSLGARLLDARGDEIPAGGGGLSLLRSVDLSSLVPPPAGGVTLLCDVDAPLCGPRGAARVFGPQKGASAPEVRLLDACLRHWAAVLGADPDRPGSGAAGGVGYGLSAAWGARIESGSAYVARLAGLDEALNGAALVVTGEGSFDEQSLLGKVVGHVLHLARAQGVPAAVVAGQVDRAAAERAGVEMSWSLTEFAGGQHAALAEPERYLREAGRALGSRLRASVETWR
jgi:glycerate kinase